jgi:hypothetical protein
MTARAEATARYETIRAAAALTACASSAATDLPFP